MSPSVRVVLPRFRSPRSPFVLGSAAVHVALAISIVFFPSLGSDRRAVEDFIVVTPVTEIPGDPAVAEAAVPPSVEQPAPQPEPEGARVEESVPELVKKPKKKKKPEPAPPTPAPTASSAPPAGPTSDPAPGEAAGGGRPGVDVASLGLDDLEYAWYRDQIGAALKSRWHRPALDGVRESIVVTIAFEILRDGSVRDPRIVAPSGIPSLDRSALRAVIEASPLPPLPPGWSEPSVTTRANFRWYPGD